MSRNHSLQQIAHFRLRVVKDAVKSGNICETARLNRVHRQSIYRWLSRYDGTLESLMDRSKKPHSHPRQHTDKERRMVLRVYHHNKRLGLVCLWVHLKQNHNYKRSIASLYRLLRREGIIPPPSKKRRRKPKPYEPILVPGKRIQVDVKYVPKACLTGSLAGRRLYQYTAIDECTRFRHIAIYDEINPQASVRFIKELKRRFPFEIECIQTDNGVEFTSKLSGAIKLSAFEEYLASEGIMHKRIAVATPRHNGKVERSHRTDQERFYNDNKFYSLKYIREQLAKYLRLSNRRPLMVHNWKSAHHMLLNYQLAL